MDKENLNLKLLHLFKEVFSYIINEIEDGKGRLSIVTNRNRGGFRITEQELRFAFVEKFLASKDFSEYSYSVDAPTDYRYQFTRYGDLVEPVCCDFGGRVANIDLVILKGKERVALIEFKANNASEHEHSKDFIKLSKEPGEQIVRWLVEIFRSSDNGTLDEVNRKLFKNKFGNIARNTDYLGLSLNHNLGEKVMFSYDREEDGHECVYL